MGGSLSGTLAGIFMKKLETDVVEPERPILYIRYVDDVYRRRLRNSDDTLFRKLNSYHTNTKFTVDPNPEQFLDSAIHREGNNITTSVYTKPNKLPIPWTSRTPKKYKRNSLKTELYRAKQISSDFDAEVDRIKTKFQNAAYPKHFIASAIKEFNTPEDTDTIPPWLFKDRQFSYNFLTARKMNKKPTNLQTNSQSSLRTNTFSGLFGIQKRYVPYSP